MIIKVVEWNLLFLLGVFLNLVLLLNLKLWLYDGLRGVQLMCNENKFLIGLTNLSVEKFEDLKVLLVAHFFNALIVFLHLHHEVDPAVPNQVN